MRERLEREGDAACKEEEEEEGEEAERCESGSGSEAGYGAGGDDGEGSGGSPGLWEAERASRELAHEQRVWVQCCFAGCHKWRALPPGALDAPIAAAAAREALASADLASPASVSNVSPPAGLRLESGVDGWTCDDLPGMSHGTPQEEGGDLSPWGLVGPCNSFSPQDGVVAQSLVAQDHSPPGSPLADPYPLAGSPGGPRPPAARSSGMSETGVWPPPRAFQARAPGRCGILLCTAGFAESISLGFKPQSGSAASQSPQSTKCSAELSCPHHSW